MTEREPNDPARGFGSVWGVRRKLARSRVLLAADDERLQAPSRLTSRPPEAAEQAPLPGVPQDRPPVEVALGDVSVAGRHLPAGGGTEPVAGDFYDVLEAGPDRLVLVLGDVMGHGLSAVARTRALRAASRSVTPKRLRPREALAELDRFCDLPDGEGLATMWLAVYVPSTGRLTYASAGHPPPVLSGGGQAVRWLELTHAPPLGMGLAQALVREHVVDLLPGATLVADSDGLVERRDADLDGRLALLRQVVQVHTEPTLPCDPQQVADAVLDGLIPDPADAQDDVALMVVRRHVAAAER